MTHIEDIDFDTEAPEGYRRTFGIPYGESVLERQPNGKLAEVVTCPNCGETIICTKRKDFESFSGVEYAKHYDDKHAIEDGLIKVGNDWYEPVPEASTSLATPYAKRKTLRCGECLEPLNGERDVIRHAVRHQVGTDGLAVEVSVDI